MNDFLADLHIHTALSPCASPEMTPPAIVAAARQQGLQIVAICDHNAAGNVEATCRAAAGDPAVLAGMEVTTAEEVHVIALFADPTAARAAAARVQATLPRRHGRPDPWGRQVLLDAEGHELGLESRLLAAASTFSLEDTVRLIHEHGGLAVAAHVDRPAFSVMSQLGVFPVAAGFDAVEISAARRSPDTLRRAAAFGLPVVTSSDSHYLADIGAARTRLRLAAATLGELRLALRGTGGRRVACA